MAKTNKKDTDLPQSVGEDRNELQKLNGQLNKVRDNFGVRNNH